MFEAILDFVIYLGTLFVAAVVGVVAWVIGLFIGNVVLLIVAALLGFGIVYLLPVLGVVTAITWWQISLGIIILKTLINFLRK